MLRLMLEHELDRPFPDFRVVSWFLAHDSMLSVDEVSELATDRLWCPETSPAIDPLPARLIPTSWLPGIDHLDAASLEVGNVSGGYTRTR